MDSDSILERAQSAVRIGDGSKAIQILRAGLKLEPESEQLRRALATIYRKSGHPDQAGRWGVTIRGWTTESERDAFAGSLLDARQGQERRLRELILVPSRAELPEDAVDVLRRANDPRRGRRGATQLREEIGGPLGVFLGRLLIAAVLFGFAAVLMLVVGVPAMVIGRIVAGGDDVRETGLGGLAVVGAFVLLAVLLYIPGDLALKHVRRQKERDGG